VDQLPEQLEPGDRGRAAKAQASTSPPAPSAAQVGLLDLADRETGPLDQAPWDQPTQISQRRSTTRIGA
jgi:hypothetical protein